MERFDANHSKIEISVCLQKFSDRAFMDIATSAKGDVGMEGAELGFQAALKRSVLHAFVKLK